MQTQRTRQNPWTKGEKFLLGAILLTVALAALGTFWWRQINTHARRLHPDAHHARAECV